MVIDLDDGLATIKADYEFLIDGRVQKHGVETWNLVETTTGWKIVSVLYSMHPGPRERGPGKFFRPKWNLPGGPVRMTLALRLRGGRSMKSIFSVTPQPVPR